MHETWLTSLIPGITISSNCESSGAALTPLGQTTFPAVTNTDIAAGPCHQSFGGNLGSLQALALDGNNAQFIIGGGGGTIITAALPEKPVPTLGFNALAALMALVVAAAFVVRGRMASLRGQ